MRLNAYLNNIHFGYIEKKSEEVTNQLAYFDGYIELKLIKSGENYYNISITFGSKGQSAGSRGEKSPGSTYIRGVYAESYRTGEAHFE